MENEVVKFLYRYMQEIKIKINNLKKQKYDYEKLIVQATEDEQEVGIYYNSFFAQYKLLKIKFYTFSIITFGLYYKIRKYDYEFRTELLKSALDDFDCKYNNIIECLSIYQHEKNNCEYIYTEYEKYIKQIDKFMECVDNMTDSEKENLLGYKIR